MITVVGAVLIIVGDRPAPFWAVGALILPAASAVVVSGWLWIAGSVEETPEGRKDDIPTQA